MCLVSNCSDLVEDEEEGEGAQRKYSKYNKGMCGKV